MTTIRLGFKAFDPHELLCHFVAEQAGLYRRENIHVELIDITFIDDTELPADTCQVSCGAALAGALKGNPQRIVFVGIDRPMFWLYAREELSSLLELRNTRLATFPAIAPPHHLANMILGKAGLNVEQDIRLLPARDDVARFGLLKNQGVDAAVLSSAIAPEKVLRSGMNKLCFFGDEVRIPTTGLAINQAWLDSNADEAQCLVNIFRQALEIIHAEEDRVARVLHEVFDVEEDYCADTASLYRSFYTADGRTTAAIAENAVSGLSRSLGLSAVPEDWRDIYPVI